MAIRDSNVLDRVNTLNTNLENANTAEIQRNISNRLFGVLDWANSISVDSELYASINDVSNASDLTTRINWITFKSVLNINGTNIRYTNPSLLPHTNTTETQSSIDNITSSENDLTSLKNNINNLRARFEDNIQRLWNIRDEQIVFTGTPRNLPAITAETNNQQQLKIRVQKILRTLSKIINEQNWAARPAVLNNLKLEFDWLDKSWITDPGLLVITNVTDTTEIANKHADYITISTDTDNRIEELKHEHELRTQINWLKTVPIHIPNWFLTFWDAETITSAWVDAAATQVLITNFENRLTQLNNFEIEIPNISTRYAENKNKLDKILQLQKLQDRLNASEITRRHDEFEAIRYISNHHLLLWDTAYEPYIPNQTTNVWWNLWPVNLNFIHNLPLVNRSATYSLCNEAWDPLRNNWWRREFQLGWWQVVNIRWITFDNAAQTMMINNLEITPIEWLTFPLNLDLNVRVRIHDNATWLDIDHHKPIHIEITRPTLAHATRENAYDSLIPPMNDRITTEYSDRYREELENEAIWKILREWWNEAEVNEIYNDETRRNLVINRIRTNLRWHFPLLTIGDLQTWFRTDMTRESRDVPVQYLLNQNSFQNYVRQSIPNNLRSFASWQINNNANIYRDNIFQEFLDFQTDVANNSKDNLDNLRVLAQVPNDNDWPQSHPDSWRQRLRRRNSRKNNYTKFFQWRSANIENQTLETEDWEIKYWVNVEVLWVNRIVATINIDGKDEPEIIEAANHDRLIRWILNRANTKDWEPLNRKLRCNIALSILKSMVIMSPQKLNREIPPRIFVDTRWNNITCDRIEADIHWWNLRIRWVRVDGNRVRRNVPIFDENQFKNLHDIDTLENWIRELSTQINSIMNASAQEYQNATDNLRENRWLLKYDTAQRLRWWPIKRLWWRIRYGKTNNNFDFDTSINEAWKNVNISFNWWKFTVMWEFDGQEYKYETKDLWLILRKKINRKRVFDWIELAMVAAINEQYVEKLRTNNLIQTENFAVSDLNENKTWKVYIFDEWGNLSYLEIEDRALNPLWGRNAWLIDPATIPVQRIRCNDQERKEFMQNPLLAGRLLREMRRRLAF